MKKIIKRAALFSLACIFSASSAQAAYVVSFEPSDTTVLPGDTFNLGMYITATYGDTFGSALSGMGLHIDLSDSLIGPGNGVWDNANITGAPYWNVFNVFPDQSNEFYTITGASFGGTTVVNDSIFLASISLQSLGAGVATVGIDKAYPTSATYTAFKVDGVSIDSLITYQDATVSAVPIPGAVWLLGSGLAGMVAMRRKKK